MFLIVLLPLEYAWMSYLPQMFFMLLHRPSTYGKTMYPLYLLLLVLGLFSVQGSFDVNETAFALHARVYPYLIPT